jgi:hypothetical protein
VWQNTGVLFLSCDLLASLPPSPTPFRPCLLVPQDFEWSPAEPLLAAYTQEVGDRPANISIIKIPDRTAVRSKQLFNVSGEFQVACLCQLEGAADWHTSRLHMCAGPGGGGGVAEAVAASWTAECRVKAGPGMGCAATGVFCRGRSVNPQTHSSA